uniref:Lon N-terminal domain-containing protein n=1 Tax=Odontella aurita TaxID=265563 RepID=A0A7S4IN35_9STRA|mmetsp:Transcript_27670/g.81334  ORF Transcript_27670/g.81334 Transcript_27670/m.81334 type:complete len:290 (+) Transcript_27670:23-892(+)
MMMSRATSCRHSFLLVLLNLFYASTAFVQNNSKRLRRSEMFGLVEWRDQGGSDARERPILILPFKAEDALMPGQSRDLILKEGRLFDLVQDSMDDHGSVIGAAFVGEDGFLDVLSLCEIHGFEVHSGYRGKVTVSITLLALGRAEMTEIMEMKPTVKGYCEEMKDDKIFDIAMASGIVDDIEAIIEDLSRREDWRNQRKLYDDAYTRTVESFESVKPSSFSQFDQILSRITAKSWAIFAAVKDRSTELEALKTTDLIKRLRLGLKAVLVEKYRMEPSINLNAGLDVGFE